MGRCRVVKGSRRGEGQRITPPARQHADTHSRPPFPLPNNNTSNNSYAKFRRLGQFEEWAVKGSRWRETREARAAAQGVTTAAGTWAADAAEARAIEAAVDADEAWERALAAKAEWTNKPLQPPGLGRSGIMEMAVTMVEARRRKQAGGGNGAGGAAVGQQQLSQNAAAN